MKNRITLTEKQMLQDSQTQCTIIVIYNNENTIYDELTNGNYNLYLSNIKTKGNNLFFRNIYKISKIIPMQKQLDKNDLLFISKSISDKMEKKDEKEDYVNKSKISNITDGYALDYNNKLLFIDNNIIQLTLKETKLLSLLCEKKGEVITRNYILNTIWGTNNYYTSRSLDVYINRLRKIFKKDPNIYIHNIHSVGYKLEIKDEKS